MSQEKLTLTQPLSDGKEKKKVEEEAAARLREWLRARSLGPI